MWPKDGSWSMYRSVLVLGENILYKMASIHRSHAGYKRELEVVRSGRKTYQEIVYTLRQQKPTHMKTHL